MDGMSDPNTIHSPRIILLPSATPRYLTPNPYVQPPMPHKIPNINVSARVLNPVWLIISPKCGIVRYAAIGGSTNHENKPPTIQYDSQCQPLTFLNGM